MGTENESSYTVYLDGVPITPGPLPEVTVTADATEQNGPPPWWMSMQGKIKVKILKRWRCRGRKRFIKLMMSEGLSRNDAEQETDFVKAWMRYAGSYENVWRKYLWRKMMGI